MTQQSPIFSTLELAACGWTPANWLQSYYPDDLPEEWRTAYYANEFDCILLPIEDWQEVVFAGYLSEVSEDFRFYLEITAQSVQGDKLDQVCKLLQEAETRRVTGLLIHADAHDVLPAECVADFAVHILPVGQWLADMPENAEAQVGLIRSLQTYSALELRECFEHLQQHTAHRDVTLFLDTPWQMLEQLRLMQQVYGV